MAINVGEAARYYQQGTAQNVNKWVSRTAAKAQEWEAKAKSTEAEQNYATGVQNAIQTQARLRGLQYVSGAEWSGAVQNAGSVYQTKTAANVNKWQRKFQPYAQVIDQVVSTLPPRIPGQGVQNLMNRAAPIVEALQRAKVSGAVSAAPAPMAAPARTAPAPTTATVPRPGTYY